MLLFAFRNSGHDYYMYNLEKLFLRRLVAAREPERVTDMTRDDTTAPQTPRRRAVLDALRASDSPLGVTEVAGQLGVHPNTVRFHLDALVTEGAVECSRQETSGPGRPRTVYAPGPEWTAVGSGATTCSPGCSSVSWPRPARTPG